MADVFPVIPEELPAQVAESIGRSPEFVFHEDGRSGSFQLVDKLSLFSRFEPGIIKYRS